MNSPKCVYSFIIPSRMPCLNEYIKALNKDRYSGNMMKQEWTRIVRMHCNKLWRKNLKNVRLDFVWVEKNRKRDKDNIAFAKKFILDGMVAGGVIANDGWKDVDSFNDHFCVDSVNPHVEVYIQQITK